MREKIFHLSRLCSPVSCSLDASYFEEKAQQAFPPGTWYMQAKEREKMLLFLVGRENRERLEISNTVVME